MKAALTGILLLAGVYTCNAQASINLWGGLGYAVSTLPQGASGSYNETKHLAAYPSYRFGATLRTDLFRGIHPGITLQYVENFFSLYDRSEFPTGYEDYNVKHQSKYIYVSPFADVVLSEPLGVHLDVMLNIGARLGNAYDSVHEHNNLNQPGLPVDTAYALTQGLPKTNVRIGLRLVKDFHITKALLASISAGLDLSANRVSHEADVNPGNVFFGGGIGYSFGRKRKMEDRNSR